MGQACLVIPIDRVAVVMLQVERHECQVLFSSRAEAKHDSEARFPKAVSVDKISHQVDTAAMHIPTQYQGELIGAVLRHNVGSS